MYAVILENIGFECEMLVDDLDERKNAGKLTDEHKTAAVLLGTRVTTMLREFQDSLPPLAIPNKAVTPKPKRGRPAKDEPNPTLEANRRNFATMFPSSNGRK
jgi:hypothetical protein